MFEQKTCKKIKVAVRSGSFSQNLAVGIKVDVGYF